MSGGRAQAKLLEPEIRKYIKKLRKRIRKLDLPSEEKHLAYAHALLFLSMEAHKEAQTHQTAVNRMKLKEIVGIDT